MKYLKRYNESVSEPDYDLIEDIKDIFLELRDEEFEFTIVPIDTKVPSIYICRDMLYNWSDVKEYFDRALEVIGNNWVLDAIVITYSDKAHKMDTGDIEELTFDTYDELNNTVIDGMLYEVIFYFKDK